MASFKCAVLCHTNLDCGESYVLLLWSDQSDQLFFGWASCLEDKISAFSISVNYVPLGLVYFVRISLGTLYVGPEHSEVLRFLLRGIFTYWRS